MPAEDSSVIPAPRRHSCSPSSFLLPVVIPAPPSSFRRKPESSETESHPQGDTVFHWVPGQARHDEVLFQVFKLSNKFVFPVEAAKVQEIRATINPTDNRDRQPAQ